MQFTKSTFTIKTIKRFEEVSGYEFTARVRGEELSFGVHKDDEGSWGVTDLRTGLSVSPGRDATRKLAVENFEKLVVPKLAEAFATEDYAEACDELRAATSTEQGIEELRAEIAELRREVKAETATDEGLASRIDALIAEHESVSIAGETSCAVYLGGIEKNSAAMSAAKEAGARFGNHKKYGKCWYFPKA